MARARRTHGARTERAPSKSAAKSLLIDSLELRRHMAADINLAINFQPASAPAVAGHLVDSGQLYGSRNGLQYGWNFNQTAATRDRNRDTDQLKDTLIYMGVGKWEVAVPNGRYTVTVNAGDPAWQDGRYDIAAEGTTVVKGVGTNAKKYLSGTQTVEVKDGKLTISNGATAYVNRISSLTIKSATTTGASNDGIPDAPSGLSQSGVSAKAVNLVWSDNSDDETGFYVQKSSDGANWAWVATVGGNTENATISGLSADTDYFFRVASFTTKGTSSYTAALAVSTPGSTPNPVVVPPSSATGLNAAGTTVGAVSLTWSDTASNETGYYVEYSGNGGASFARLATLSANSNSYTASGLVAGRTYYFRVQAYNSAGSATSTVASATAPTGATTPPPIQNNDVTMSSVLGNVSANIDMDGIEKWAPQAKALGIKRIRTWYNVRERDWATHGAVGQWIIDRLAKWKSYGFEVMLTVDSPKAPTQVAYAERVFNLLANSGLRNVVDYWQIGNEVNWRYSFNDSMANYVNRMLAPAYRQLHAVGELVVGAGPTYDVNACKTLVSLGYNNFVDFAAFHPYGTSGQMVVDRVKGAVDAFAGKPVILTEWNVINSGGMSDAKWAKEIDIAAKGIHKHVKHAYYFALARYNDPTVGAAGVLVNSQPNGVFYNMFNAWT